MQTTSQVEIAAAPSRKFHEDGTLPKTRMIFVFGSNLAGVHGAGAARIAAEKYGALNGVGEGKEGWSYALPTKDRHIQTLEIWQIECHIRRFITAAEFYGQFNFFVTRVGCGLAGYQDFQIARLFKDAPYNCSFAKEWDKFL